MIFTLEALDAKHGDALLLHYGDPDAPQLVVIDGGPAGVFGHRMRPRLDDLRRARAPDGGLPIRMLLVSHIDDDHVHGVLDLTDFLIERKEQGEPAPYEITTLWHNSFHEVVGRAAGTALSSVEQVQGASLEQLPGRLPVSRETSLVLASVGQGERLRNNADQLNLTVNEFFEDVGVVMGPHAPVEPAPGLKLTVIGPGQEQVDALREDWEKKSARAKQGQATPQEMEAILAAYLDESVYNLSSIVVLAEMGGKRILLTGDARGDFILSGLEGAGVLRDGAVHVDLLKVPHHGSERDVEPDFFRRVTADHYVISANGKYGNPDPPTLEMLSEARGDSEYTIHITNHVPHADAFWRSDAAGKRYTVAPREDDRGSLKVDLLDPLQD